VPRSYKALGQDDYSFLCSLKEIFFWGLQFYGFCRVKHVMITSLLLVCGAMTTTWICDTISESGFGIIHDMLIYIFIDHSILWRGLCCCVFHSLQYLISLQNHLLSDSFKLPASFLFVFPFC
jgi:preprotein translocase subunit SecY